MFAAQSLEYNLKDKLFCELFPDTVVVSNGQYPSKNEINL